MYTQCQHVFRLPSEHLRGVIFALANLKIDEDKKERFVFEVKYVFSDESYHFYNNYEECNKFRGMYTEPVVSFYKPDPNI